jgi:hypothetical protein
MGQGGPKRADGGGGEPNPGRHGVTAWRQGWAGRSAATTKAQGRGARGRTLGLARLTKTPRENRWPPESPSLVLVN